MTEFRSALDARAARRHAGSMKRESTPPGRSNGATRRSVLAGGAAALLCGGAASAAGAGDAGAPSVRGSAPATGPVDPAARALAATLTGPALLDAFVRMRGRADGGLVYGWLESQRSAVIDGDVTPLFDVVAGAVSRYERLGDSLVEATVLEVAHYVDPASGELLKTLTMPGAASAIDVPVYRFGPTKVRFAVDHDEWEEFVPAQGGSNAAKFAPRASVHLVRSIAEPMAFGRRVSLRANEFGRVYPDRAKPPTVYYREWMTWHAAAADLANRRLVSVPAEYGYTALTSWRPWMRMGDVRGHTIDHGSGAKADRWSDCNPRFVQLLSRTHPDVLDDPERALAAKPA
jgi:hypothetical protein